MAKITRYESTQIPLRDKIAEVTGFVAYPWQEFFRYIKASLDPLGEEKSAVILNNQATFKDITSLAFNSAKVSQATIDYVVQRVTTGAGAVELIQSGILLAVYRPTLNIWNVVQVGTPGPSSGIVTFTITPAGQVQYTSTNITGTPSISRIAFRARTISLKSNKYSDLGPIE